MKIFGYVRDKDGRFDKRKERVVEFAKLIGFSLTDVICEKSSKEYEDMGKARNLVESEENFILIVSDTSDLFEDDFARLKFCKSLEDNNIFLIDSFYPNLDYRMLAEKNCKDCPSNFLINMLMVGLESYFRKKSSDSEDAATYSDMRMRLNEWKRSI